MFWSKAKYSTINVLNLNDVYAKTINDVGIALGKKTSPIYRKKYHQKIFVLDFDGDLMATRANNLGQEITAILYNAKEGDEVLVRLNSPGGAAHAYGYAASQLERLKSAKIPLTISVDKVAASGGYMMACVADKIIAAPYAIIGSIGVVVEFPNFFKLLKNLGVDYKQYTAGKFKRTVSSMGPITEEGEQKLEKDLQEMHTLFQNHIKKHRPEVELEKVATGEHWQGLNAKSLGLVDEIKTSDEYLVKKLNQAEILKISYIGPKKSFIEQFSEGLSLSIFNIFMKIINNIY